MTLDLETGLTADEVRRLLSYDPETGSLHWKDHKRRCYIGKPAGYVSKDSYAKVKIRARIYMAHRLIWLIMTGEWPKEQIDHRDLNRSNNRWANLREATRAQNGYNREVFSTTATKLKGAYKAPFGSGYVAAIRVNKKLKRIGLFRTPEEAHAAYCVAAQKFAGEFARF